MTALRKLLTSLLIILLSISTFGQTGFVVEEKIPYKTGDNYVLERCYMNIRYPIEADTLPVIVWFHGGGLTGGEPYFPAELLNENAVLVAVSYRLSPGVQVSDCIDDAAASVAYVLSNISDFHGDPERVIVSGHSAGGYLTSMIGLDKKYLAKYNTDADNIKALFPFSGHTITHFTVRKERGIPGTQAIIDEMAPLFHVRKDAPPLYLLTGDRELEMLGRYEENAYMWRMMKVVGHENTFLYEFDGHNHGAMVAPGCHVLKTYLKELAK